MLDLRPMKLCIHIRKDTKMNINFNFSRKLRDKKWTKDIKKTDVYNTQLFWKKNTLMLYRLNKFYNQSQAIKP